MRLAATPTAGRTYATLEGSRTPDEKVIVLGVNVESVENDTGYAVSLTYSTPTTSDSADPIVARHHGQQLAPRSVLLGGEGLLYSVNNAELALLAGVRCDATAASVLAADLGPPDACGARALVRDSVLQRFVLAECGAARTRLDIDEAAVYAARIGAYASIFAPVPLNAVTVCIVASEPQDGSGAGVGVGAGAGARADAGVDLPAGAVTGMLCVTCIPAT